VIIVNLVNHPELMATLLRASVEVRGEVKRCDGAEEVYRSGAGEI